jgi:hypothetical protein
VNPSSRTDLDVLAQMLSTAGGRELPPGRPEQLRAALMAEFRRSAPAEPRWWRRPRVAGPVAALAVTVGACAALIAFNLPLAPDPATAVDGPAATPSASRPSVSPGHQAPAAHETPAAQLLAKIAVAVGQQPAPAVRSSDYEYVRSLERFVSYTERHGHQVARLQPGAIRETWLPVADRCRPVRIHQPGLIQGHPTITSSERTPGAKCPELGSLTHPTYRWETTAPTNPHVLLRIIGHAVQAQAKLNGSKYPKGQSQATYEFSFIGDMLNDQIVPPKFSAALYRTAALIPGVRVIRGVPNADGQRGIAMAIKDGGSWREWIFNPATLLPIGMREMGRSATASYPGGNAILVTGIVSRIGQVPGGSH